MQQRFEIYKKMKTDGTLRVTFFYSVQNISIYITTVQ